MFGLDQPTFAYPRRLAVVVVCSVAFVSERPECSYRSVSCCLFPSFEVRHGGQAKLGTASFPCHHAAASSVIIMRRLIRRMITSVYLKHCFFSCAVALATHIQQLTILLAPHAQEALVPNCST